MNDLFLNWVNSIEYPNCLLATSIQDFYSGVVFCEIINEKILQNQRPDFLPKIKNHNPSYYDSIYNVEMALQALTSQKPALNIPPEIEQLKSQEVVKDDAKILMLLKYLYSLFNPGFNHMDNFATTTTNTHNHQSGPHLYEYDSTSSKTFATNQLENQFYSTVNSQPDKTLSKKPPVIPSASNFKSLKNTPAISISTTVPSSNKHQPQQNLKPISASDFGNMRNPSHPHHPHHQQYNTLQNPTINFDQKENSLPSEFASLNNLKMIQSPTSVSSIACVDHSKGMISDFNFLQSPKPSLPGLNKISGFNSGTSSPANSKKNNEYSAPDSIIIHDHDNKDKMPTSDLHFLTSWGSENDQKIEDVLKKAVYTIENEIESTPYFKQNGGGSRSLNRIDEQPLSGGLATEPREYKLEGRFSIEPPEKDHSGPYEVPPRRMAKSASVGGLRQSRPQTASQKSPQHQTFSSSLDIPEAQLLHWLRNLKVLKGNLEVTTDGQLPKNCKNGYIIAELINKLEKKDVLKGIIQNTEIKLNMKSNLQKIMAHLRKCKDMNPRFFNAQEQIINGNHTIFWGLLSDIYHLYSKNQAPHWSSKDFSERKQTPSKNNDHNRRKSCESNLFDFSDSASAIDTLRKCSPDSIKEHDNYNSGREIPKIMIERVSVENSKRFESPVPMKRRIDEAMNNNSTPRRPSQRNSYTSIHHSRKESYGAYSQRGTPRDSSARKRLSARGGDTERLRFSPREEPSRNSHRQREPEECTWTLDLEGRIAEWLKELGLSTAGLHIKEENSSLFKDPLRNGTLFAQIIEKLLQEKMSRLYQAPKSIDECRCNVYSIFNIINKRSIPIPLSIKGKQEAILKGNRNIIFGLLQALKQFYESKFTPDLNFMPESQNPNEVGTHTLPYNEMEIERLENSLLHWLYSLRIPSFMRMGGIQQTFNHFIQNFKNGLLLCELISVVIREKYIPRHIRPVNESQCLANIQKCLEDLRKREWMGQRYLWKEKLIYEGNKFVVLGLLEDIRRFSDGLPPRMPPNYFVDGPYIPESKTAQSIDLKKPVEDLMFETMDNINTNLFSTESVNRNSFGFASRDNYGTASEYGFKMPPSNATMNSRYYSSTHRNSSLPRPPSAGRGSVMQKGSPSHYQMILKNNFGSTEKPGIEKYNRPASARKYQENSSSNRSRSGSASKERTSVGDSKNGSSQGFYRNLVQKSKSPSISNKHMILNHQELVMDYKLKQWLVSLNIPGLPRDSNFQFSELPRLSDGLILVKILEKLEKKKLNNITLNPTNKRDCIVNIKMCLRNLIHDSKKIRHFDSKFEENLIRGDINAFKELFITLMEIYS